ncbi:hypothetical protein Tco_1179959 [Tanacetum coccineum]
MSAVQRFLAGAVLNAEVGVAAILTLPFVTASVSTTPEHDVGNHTDSVAGPNLRTIRAPQRFVISSYSSQHSGANVAEAEVDSIARSSTPIMTTVTTVTSTVDLALVAKENPVKPSLFSADSSLAGGAYPNTGVFSDLTGSDFLVGGIRTVIDPNTNLQKVYVSQWSVTNGSRLDDSRVCREMLDEFAPPKFFVSARGMEHDQLFNEFNVGAARQMSLSAESLWDEMNALKERNIILEKEQSALDVKVTYLEASAMGKECELTNLNAQLTSVKSQNDNLADQVHELELSSSGLQENLSGCGSYRDGLPLGGKIYPHLLMTISSWRWLLTHGLKLVLVKCLNSSECLTALGAAISRPIEKGMQSGLATGIDHGKKGRSLADVVAYNPDAKADFNSAIQKFREVDFPLLAGLKSHKDASMEDIMNLLHLEGALAGAPGIDELQPDIEQLRVPIHRSEDHVVLALLGVLTPLSEPLSVSSLMDEASTSGVVPTASVVTTALSTTFASASSIPPISTDDYEIAGVDSREGARADGNATPFPNVDDIELNILQ